MLPRPSQRRHRVQAEKELQITSFLNLMVILIPFLLITAVFSRLAVLEISLPTATQTAASTAQVQNLGLVIRILAGSIEVHTGGKKIADFADTPAMTTTKTTDQTTDKAVGGSSAGRDIQGLSSLLRELKSLYPKDEAVTIMSQAQTPYQTLIQVMDVSRESGFPEIALGEVRSP